MITAKQKRKINRIISTELRAGTKLYVAISKTSLKSPNTYYVWMRKNPRLKNWVKELQEICDHNRNTIVEDKFFERLKTGKATGAEYFFYLCNRMPGRWINKYRLEQTGKDDEPLNPPEIHYHFTKAKQILTQEFKKEEKSEFKNRMNFNEQTS